MTVTRRISKIIKDGIEYNIVGGGSEAVDTQLDTTSENPVQNKVIAQAINGKQDTLTAGENVTIATNQQTGNLEISATDTKYTNATETSDGLMSASDKKKLGNMKEFYQVDVLLVGGGGGGGGGSNQTLKGGGGGAGELKIINGLILRETILNVVVGNGGGGALYNGTNGGYSSFGNVVAIGGGAGGGGNGCMLCSGHWGGNGGGGGGRCGNNAYGGFGIMNTGANSCCVNGGGGGGVGGPGGEVGYFEGYSQMFRGGRGIQTNFGGVNICIGGGGAGGGFNGTGAGTFPQLAGQCYGGGVGQNSGTTGGYGTANTGGGGAGGNNAMGGAGGSGLVIVRYPKDCSYGIACATGGTITTPTINGIQYVVHTFTSSGTFCITG